MNDPLREKLKDSLAYAPLCGIDVRIISGDHLDTVKAVAVDAGIMTQDESNKTSASYAMDA